jgi:hypothetical protein
MKTKTMPSAYTIEFVYFDHVYRTGSFMPNAVTRHCCLSWGYWCWSNLGEHPMDIVQYIKRKLKK